VWKNFGIDLYSGAAVNDGNEQFLNAFPCRRLRPLDPAGSCRKEAGKSPDPAGKQRK